MLLSQQLSLVSYSRLFLLQTYLISDPLRPRPFDHTPCMAVAWLSVFFSLSLTCCITCVCLQPKPTFDEMSPELTALLKSAREQKSFKEHNLLKVPVCLSLSTCLYVSLSLYLSIFLSLSFLPACLSLFFSTCLSACLSLCLSVSQ